MLGLSRRLSFPARSPAAGGLERADRKPARQTTPAGRESFHLYSIGNPRRNQPYRKRIGKDGDCRAGEAEGLCPPPENQLTFGERSDLRFDGGIIRKVTGLGVPIALQDFLVGISFLVLLAIVNGLGLVASAGIGVAEKVCGFIMLIPAAFMQAMAAFVAQNIGAGKYPRARKALIYAIAVSTMLAMVMFAVTFWRGDLLSGIFANDPEVIFAAADYLKAYAIDCLLTCFLFCFIGFFNGLGMTRFVMIQGIIGAFLVRIPVAFWMSRQIPVSMFHVGLATPCSTILQVALCLIWFRRTNRKYAGEESGALSGSGAGQWAPERSPGSHTPHPRAGAGTQEQVQNDV